MRQAFWTIADQVLVSAANFILTVIVARWLDADEFALFSLYYLAAMFTMALHRTLITQPMNIFGAGKPTEDNAARYRAMLRLTCALSLGVALVVGSLSALIGVPTSLWLSAIAFGFCLNFQETVRRHQFTLGRIENALWFDVVAYGLAAPALLIFVLSSGYRQAALVFSIMAFCMVLSFVIGNRAIGSPPSLPSPRTFGSYFEEHWSASNWNMATQFLYFGSVQIYPFLLASFSGAEAVATYAAATAILNVFNLLRLSLNSYLPTAAALPYRQHGSAGLRAFMTKAILGSAFVAIIMAVALAFFSREIDRLLYAGRFPELPSVLPAMAFLQIFSVISVITNVGGLIVGQAQWIFISYAVSTVFSLTIGLWMVLRLGLTGAMWAMGLSCAIAAIIQGVHIFSFLSAEERSPTTPKA